MSTETVRNLIDSWQIAGLATWRDGPIGERVHRCVGDQAADAARLHFLRLETAVAHAGKSFESEASPSLKAEAAIASMDFGDAVGEQLAKCLGSSSPEVRWAAVRMFWCQLAEIARAASAGGRA